MNALDVIVTTEPEVDCGAIKFKFMMKENPQFRVGSSAPTALTLPRTFPMLGSIVNESTLAPNCLVFRGRNVR